MTEITPKIVRELLAGITPGEWVVTDFASAAATEKSPAVDKCKILAIQKKALGALQRTDANFIAAAPAIATEYLRVCELLDTYIPFFDKIVYYVQKHSSNWDIRNLGKRCDDVIIARCEKLAAENQRLDNAITAKDQEIFLLKSWQEKFTDSRYDPECVADSLRNKVEKLRTALEFYAYKHGYQPYYDSVHGDEGEIAREALKEQPL